MDKAELLEILECLKTDIQMFTDESWIPDHKSFEASIDSCDKAIKILTREEPNKESEG